MLVIPPADRHEELLGEVLAEATIDQEAALARVCAAHPEYAEGVRLRFAALCRMGLASTSPTVIGVGTQFGRYRLIEELGRGGMGVVFLAEQVDLRRKVALKVLHPGLLDQERARERFQREIGMSTRIDHPGICAVFEAGEVGGVPFLAMRHVPGRTLAAQLDELRRTGQRPDPEQMLALLTKVAGALAAAHAARLVHRDVKPGNIQIDETGEPVLLDFGLARALEGEGRSLTMTGDVVGTPSYLAPEQIDGRRPIGPWTDVFALGVVLYEALTLSLPFVGRTRDSLYRAILGDAPAWTKTATALPTDLRVVLEVALDKDPARRYADAAALAEDLLRVQRKEPISARATPGWLRARRWCQRNPFAATALLVLAAGLMASLWLAGARDQALQQSEANRRANLAWRKLDQEPRTALREALLAVDASPTLENLASLHAALQRPHRVREWDPLGVCSNGFDSSLDGRNVAFVSGNGDLHVLNGERFRWVGRVQSDLAPDLRFAPSGTEFAVAARSDGAVRVYSAEGELRLHIPIPESGEPMGLDWHPTSPTLVVAASWDDFRRTRVFLFDTQDGRLLRELEDPDHPVDGPAWATVRFAAEGRRVVLVNGFAGTKASPGGQYHFRAWDAASGSVCVRHQHHTLNVRALAVSGDLVLSGGFDQRVVLTDVVTGVVHAHELGSAVRSVGFLPDSQLWVASESGHVHLLDRTLQTTGSLAPAAGRQVESVVPLSAHQFLVSVGDVGRFVIDHQGRQITRLPGSKTLQDRSFDRGFGERVLTHAGGESLCLWEPTTRGLLRFAWPNLVDLQLLEGGGFLGMASTGEVVLRDETGAMVWRRPHRLPYAENSVCAATADRSAVALCEVPDLVRVFDVAKNQVHEVRTKDKTGVRLVSLDATASRILLLDNDNTWQDLRRTAEGDYEWAPGSVQRRGYNRPCRFRPVAPQAPPQVAVGGRGCALLEANGNEWREQRELVPPATTGCIPAFSRDGRWLAVGANRSGQVLVFDLEAAVTASPVVLQHGPGLTHISLWSGDRLVTTSNDEVSLWSRTGEKLTLLRTPREAGFLQAVLSADGARIVTLYNDLVVETWFAESKDAIRAAREILDQAK